MSRAKKKEREVRAKQIIVWIATNQENQIKKKGCVTVVDKTQAVGSWSCQCYWGIRPTKVQESHIEEGRKRERKSTSLVRMTITRIMW